MPIPALVRGLFAFLLGFTLVLALMGTRGHSATTLLPNGEQCFQQASGPVSSGSINMFTPGTTTPKNTWQNSSQTVLNTNPIQLDANGCAIIYGTGSYRQQLFSGPVVSGVTTGNLIFDLTTADTSSFNAVFWAGTSGGTANAITVADAGFNNTDGSVINFLALNTNTGAATLNVSGGGAVPIETPSVSGPVAIASGCITANNPVSVVYSSTDAAFLLLTACQAGGSATPQGMPQGYLTLSSSTDSPVITADVLGATTIYYTPYVGNQIPIWNGTSYSIFTFTQLILPLSASAQLGNTIYDVCVFSNNGTPTAVFGPAWSNSSAGTSARGTGAGTTQLQRVSGLWVNAVQISANNGTTTYTVSANQCTYIGSVLIDQAAGQISNYLSWGQNRKWGVFNAYNRAPIQVQAGDNTSSWTLNAAGWRFSNATGGNGITTLTGLAEQGVPCSFTQIIGRSGSGTGTSFASIGIAINVGSITPTGKQGVHEEQNANASGIGVLNDAIALNYATSPLGVTTFSSVEWGAAASGTEQFSGTPGSMVLQCSYRG